MSGRDSDPSSGMLLALALTFSACCGLFAYLMVGLVQLVLDQRAGVF